MLGVRAARLQFEGPDKTQVTLFPMVHVGEAQFYASVYADALNHDVVLYEGIRSPVGRHLTRSYRWINVGRLGLVVQPRFAEYAIGHPRMILADLAPSDFHVAWRSLSIWTRLLIHSMVPVFALTQRLTLSRESLASRLSLEDRRSSDELLDWTPALERFDYAVLGARDESLVRHLETEIAATPGRRIAIVYGAGHMRAVLARLKQLGFRSAGATWQTVFSL